MLLFPFIYVIYAVRRFNAIVMILFSSPSLTFYGIASADGETARQYPEQLAKIIEDGGYCPDQIFNADETGLFWKKMPTRTYIAKAEKKAYGFKATKDRITFLLCSNASGDRMLKPLLINRSLRPRALKGKDLKKLPVHWMANKKAWMTSAVFTEWFNNCFIPEVEVYLKQKGLGFKALLIVDNAPSHPNLEHPNVNMVFLPPNTTSLIQPLDQGIIATFKKYYVKRTFQFILNQLDNEPVTLTDVWKRFSILDCINHASSAIGEIRPQTLNACWKTLWPRCITNKNAINQESTVSAEIIALAHEIGGEGFDTFNENDVDELFVDNALSDDDVIELLDLVLDPENNSDVEDSEPAPLTAKIIREGLQLCNSLENHFINNDPNSERAFKFQRDLKNCISGYQELLKPFQKSSQSLITDFVVKEAKPPAVEINTGCNEG